MSEREQSEVAVSTWHHRPFTIPSTPAEAAKLRARTREVDAELGALLRPATTEDE